MKNLLKNNSLDSRFSPNRKLAIAIGAFAVIATVAAFHQPVYTNSQTSDATVERQS